MHTIIGILWLAFIHNSTIHIFFLCHGRCSAVWNKSVHGNVARCPHCWAG